MDSITKWITIEDGKAAANTLYHFMKQYENTPITYQQSSLSIIAIRLEQIARIQVHMRKLYKKQLKELDKEGKITYISKDEFYYI